MCSGRAHFYGTSTTSADSIMRHRYAKNGTYLVRVEGNNCSGSGCTGSVTITVTNSAPAGPCPTIDNAFDIDFNTLGEIQLKARTQSMSNVYTWRAFPHDGKEGMSGPGEYIFNAKFKNGDAGSKVFRFWINTNGGCEYFYKQDINVEEPCCERGHHQGKNTWDFATDHKMKYKIFRWNGGPLGRNVGAKTVHFEYRKRKFSIRRNPNKHWIRTRVSISAMVTGSIWVGNRRYENSERPSWNSCQREEGVSKSEAKNSKANADVVYNPLVPDNHLVYTKKNKLSSIHTINWNGNTYSRELKLTICP